jgi:hypothetical protein
MRRFAAIVLLAAVLSPSPAEALCAMPLRPKVLTADVTTSDGGVVVGTDVGYSGDGGKDQGEAAQPTWEIKTKTGKVKPVMVTLAPGLVAYRLPDNVDGGELFDGNKVIAKVTRSQALIPKLAAPGARKVIYKEWPSRRGRSEQTAVTVDAVPAEAIALVVVDAKTMKPRSYGLVAAGAKEIFVYAQGRCSALPNGSVRTAAGDKVILRWVDKTGAVSADSKPIVVAKG